MMTYIQHINQILKPSLIQAPLVLDLFAGCGGFSLGFESQGFATYGFEKNRDACATYSRNLKGKCAEIVLNQNTIFSQASVIIGSPPCQPFSVGGKQQGIKDCRDGFPIFIEAIKQIQPKIWLFENVRGFLYKNKAYFDSIIKTLAAIGYIIEWRLLNAVHYGVPQNRERLIVVGHRGKFQFPRIQSKIVTAGEALGESVFETYSESKILTHNMDNYIAKYEKASCCKNPRDLHLHQPARTLTCRNLAGATGDMHRIKLPDGRRRRLLVQEAARLQSFPDWFEFIGTETSCFNQIGNAVPPLLAFYLADSVKKYLASTERELIPTIKPDYQPLQLALPLEL